MAEETRFVDYKESLSVRAQEFLIAKGFGLAEPDRMATNSPPSRTDSISILYKDPDLRPRKYFFGLLEEKPRRAFLGTIWLSNEACSASKKNWVWEMSGRKYVELVKNLAEEMASKFNVRISICLIDDDPKLETFWEDFAD